MSIYILFTIILLGFLSNYSLYIKQVKLLRNNQEPIPKLQMALVTILYGGPVIYLIYMFKEFRELDKKEHYFYIIYGSIMTVIQITVTVLLFVFFSIELA